MLHKSFLFFIFDLFLAIPCIWGQSASWDNNPQIVDYYNVVDTNFHRYQYTTALCALKDNRKCNIDSAFKLFLTDSKFIAPTYGSTAIKDGSISFVRLSLPFFNVPGLHPIKTLVSIKNHVAINYTLPGHLLHPGMVERKIIQANDSLYLLTIGTGYSKVEQFVTEYNGQCNNEYPLKFIKTFKEWYRAHESITFYKEFKKRWLEFSLTFADDIKKSIDDIADFLNESPCIVIDTWGPVHSLFTNAFNNYINLPTVAPKPKKKSGILIEETLPYPTQQRSNN